jgi:hypothetical protein
MAAAPAAVAHHREKHDTGKATPSGGGSDHDGDADNGSTVTTEDNDADGVSNAGDTNESHHPSGKDRFLEKGGSGNQGHSESDPDDNVGPMRREEPPCDSDPRGADKCTDKPGGSGGHDTLDQDTTAAATTRTSTTTTTAGAANRPSSRPHLPRLRAVRSFRRRSSVLGSRSVGPWQLRVPLLRGRRLSPPPVPCRSRAQASRDRRGSSRDDHFGGRALED